jgi:RecA-family ATPase
MTTKKINLEMGVFRAAEIIDTPEPVTVVSDILPAGLTILAAAPKSGKSLLALDLLLAVTQGLPVLGQKAAKGEGLYLSLEGGRVGLARRLRQKLAGKAVPEGLFMATEWAPAGKGGIERLEAWLDLHPECRLVVIDTLAAWRGEIRQARGQIYDSEYAEMAALEKLAVSRQIAVLVVAHTTKRECEDAVQTVGGTSGITGGADAVWILARRRATAEAKLFVTGREIEETELEILLEDGTWTMPEVNGEPDLNPGRLAIVELIKHTPMTPAQIAKTLDRNDGTVRWHLSQMSTDGLVRKNADGTYTAARRAA